MAPRDERRGWSLFNGVTKSSSSRRTRDRVRSMFVNGRSDHAGNSQGISNNASEVERMVEGITYGLRLMRISDTDVGDDASDQSKAKEISSDAGSSSHMAQERTLQSHDRCDSNRPSLDGHTYGEHPPRPNTPSDKPTPLPQTPPSGSSRHPTRSEASSTSSIPTLILPGPIIYPEGYAQLPEGGQRREIREMGIEGVANLLRWLHDASDRAQVLQLLSDSDCAKVIGVSGELAQVDMLECVDDERRERVIQAMARQEERKAVLVPLGAGDSLHSTAEKPSPKAGIDTCR
ncbi:hypothetical protein H2201_008799 [Coniosporium apollinis]|uniref:SAM domain-containing protein n=2 Tax=Coniosporium TaxID=2810619 RepID=A0ABQ9NKD8_9PEZI|nr:hypothetical protein H2199_004019 [Cladosporium sp. JES 115]KAJ9655454.1 hypothetical protein H2201_008799 [Coniosporium apollinis]